jgi:shikimate 5-dehydrogenase
LRAHAKDPISSGRSLDEFIPRNYWSETGSEVLLFGAGGSNLAITLHLMTAREAHDRPRRIVVVNRSPARLASMRGLHERLSTGVRVEYIENADASENDRLVTALPAGSLVVNGTGMGKDIPGSPITREAVFPERGVVWELNYRGKLDFLHFAERQQRARALTVEDGWRYFVHGWTTVIEEVFDVAITPAIVDALAAIALPLRAA